MSVIKIENLVHDYGGGKGVFDISFHDSSAFFICYYEMNDRSFQVWVRKWEQEQEKADALKGEKVGEERISKLYSLLLQNKKYDDLERATKDYEFQKHFFLYIHYIIYK